jgi:hypothetical protein
MGVLELRSDQETKTVHRFLKSQDKFHNAKGEQIRIDYCFDARRLEEERWAAVVLRNLPPVVDAGTIARNCEKGTKAKVLYVLPVKEIRKKLCAVVRVRDIEDAEQVCRRLNNQTITDKQFLRAHVHPESNFDRPNKETSANTMFREHKYFSTPEYHKFISSHSTVAPTPLEKAAVEELEEGQISRSRPYDHSTPTREGAKGRRSPTPDR